MNAPQTGPLTDGAIRNRLGLAESDPRRLRIEPFSQTQIKTLDGQPCVGFGLTGMGYDIRLGPAFRAMKPRGLQEHMRVLDPLRETAAANYGDEERQQGEYIIPPNGCVLAQSLEWLRIPDDVIGVVMGKSTWARCFLNLNCTPLEPGWQGIVTLELANLSPLPLRVHVGHGIGQVVFLAAAACSLVPYHSQPGASYQDQTGPTLPRQSGRPDGLARPAGPDGRASA